MNKVKPGSISDRDLLFEVIAPKKDFEGKSILQIGAKPGGSWHKIFEEFAKLGYERFDVLEIYGPNISKIRGDYLNKKIKGDVRSINEVVDETYDITLWWHGPQLVEKKNFPSILQRLIKITNKYIVLGLPHGRFDKPSEYGNKWEEHISHWTPKELEEFGFEVWAYGRPGERLPMVAVLDVVKYKDSLVVECDESAPRVVAVTQCYNEVDFIDTCIECVQPYVDAIIITESCNSPYLDLCKWTPFSNDGTHEKMEELVGKYDNVHCATAPAISEQAENRTHGQGVSKKVMFDYGEKHNLLGDNDWIWILDADEFYSKKSVRNIVRLLKTDYKDFDSGIVPEWQFAYSMHYAFLTSHRRFMKYKRGSSIEHVHSLIWPDGKSPWKGRQFYLDVRDALMFHLSYIRHPKRIREKMLSFNRPHYFYWFNKVYIPWTYNRKTAYENNMKTPAHPGEGWHWGCDCPLMEFDSSCLIDPCKKFCSMDYYEDVLTGDWEI